MAQSETIESEGIFVIGVGDTAVRPENAVSRVTSPLRRVSASAAAAEAVRHRAAPALVKPEKDAVRIAMERGGSPESPSPMSVADPSSDTADTDSETEYRDDEYDERDQSAEESSEESSEEHETFEMHKALIEASMAGCVETTRLLLDSGAQVNMPTDSFVSPLTLAVCGGHVEVALLLIDNGANIEEVKEYTPLMEAARNGLENMVSVLLSKGANINAQTEEMKETALTLACRGGFLFVADILIKNGAILEHGALTPLIEAAQEGHLNLVRYLLECGANIHAQTTSADTALTYACENGQTDVADLLLHFGADIEHESEGGRTPLMKACRAGNLCTVQFLISRNAVINKDTGNKDDTPLSLACAGGHLAVVKVLLEYSADIMCNLKDNSTMVIEAAKGGHTNVVKFLLDYLNTINSTPVTPVISAQDVIDDEFALLEVQVKSEFYAKSGKNVVSYGPDAQHKFNSCIQESTIRKEQLNAPDLYSDHPQFEIEVPKKINTMNFPTFVTHTNMNKRKRCLTERQQSSEDIKKSFQDVLQMNCGTLPMGRTSSNSEISSFESCYPIPEISYIMVNSQTEKNRDTALTIACEGGHEDLVKLLLVRGAHIEHHNKLGFTPLMVAAMAGFDKIVEILLNNKAFIKEAQCEQSKDTPLSLACANDNYKVCELLLQRGADKERRNKSDYTPLMLAAVGGYVNIVELLLNYGAEINSRIDSKSGISPLILAAINGHTAAVKLLLDLGSDVNAQIEFCHNTALTLACYHGRHEVVSILLDGEANIEHRNKSGLTPLMVAASGGYVDVGRVLIDKGADVNTSAVLLSGVTALTIAADYGHERFVELLLEKNAHVEIKEKNGNSPLWLAANGGYLKIIKLLYKVGAKIDSKNYRQVTCLMAAFRKGHVRVVEWMVNHGSQLPRDQEMARFRATLSDKESVKNCLNCMLAIRVSKDQRAARDNKNASTLLEGLEKN